MHEVFEYTGVNGSDSKHMRFVKSVQGQLIYLGRCLKESYNRTSTFSSVKGSLIDLKNIRSEVN